jgi:outer membrane lipoprotein SlyB
LRCVAQTDLHEWKLEQAERSGTSGLLDVVGMGGDLVVRSHQIDFRKDGATGKLAGVVVDMVDGIAVGNGPGVQRSVVAAMTPTIVLLGYVWRR